MKESFGSVDVHTNRELQKISDEEFEKQLVEQTVTVDDHEIAFVRITPPEKVSEQPVLYVGGFATEANMYDDLKDLAQQGREVIFANPIRGIPTKSEEASQNLKEFGIAETIQRKGLEVVALLDELDIQNIDLVCHSQGAAVSTVVAALRPGTVENLILTSPAGMSGEDSWWGIIGRTLKGQVRQFGYNVARNSPNFYGEPDGQGFKPEEAARRTNAWVNAQKNEGPRKDTWWRITEEAQGIVDTNILPLLKYIKERNQTLDEDKRTRVHLLTANEDDTFDAKKIEQNLGYPEDLSDENKAARDAAYEAVFENYIDSHSMYINKHATHDAPVFEKTGAIGQILDSSRLVREQPKRK